MRSPALDDLVSVVIARMQLCTPASAIVWQARISILICIYDLYHMSVIGDKMETLAGTAKTPRTAPLKTSSSSPITTFQSGPLNRTDVTRVFVRAANAQVRKGRRSTLVYISDPRQQETTDPVALQCKTIARVYDNAAGFSGDVRRLRKRGWKIVNVRPQRKPLYLERIRAECPGALTRFSTLELIAFYTRCRAPQDNSLKRVVFRRIGHT